MCHPGSLFKASRHSPAPWFGMSAPWFDLDSRGPTWLVAEAEGGALPAMARLSTRTDANPEQGRVQIGRMDLMGCGDL
jgi:hypothetical protein